MKFEDPYCLVYVTREKQFALSQNEHVIADQLNNDQAYNAVKGVIGNDRKEINEIIAQAIELGACEF